MNINKIPKRFLRNVVTHMVSTLPANSAVNDFDLSRNCILINTDGLSTRLWSQSTEEWKPVPNFVTTDSTVYKEVELSDPINERFLIEAMREFEDYVNSLATEIKEAEFKLRKLQLDIKVSKEKLAEYQTILES
jgi:hypothetical protein